jgi:hypothetical protein
MSALGQEKILGQLEGEDEREKVDLILHPAGESPGTLEVRSLRWGPGVGWYVQKTISLDPGQVSRLAETLRTLPRRRESGRHGDKIIPFPRKSK